MPQRRPGVAAPHPRLRPPESHLGAADASVRPMEPRQEEKRAAAQPGGAPGPGAREDAASASEVAPGPCEADWEECPLCLLAQPGSAFPRPPCAHRSCLSCLQRYVRLEVRGSRVPVACPHCPAPLPPALLQRLLLAAEPGLREQHDAFLLRRLLLAEPDARWCPAPDCSYAVIASGCGDCPRLVCGRPECRTEFCYHCRQRWHPGAPCEQAWRPCDRLQRRAQEGPEEEAPPAKRRRNAAAEQGAPEAVKPCPRCGAFIMKAEDGGCNRMSCPLCGCLFCWLCLREISDVHFLSPSGCTFWGKKPWSRTRKCLWRLGMVLGAPMVISLVAGVAVPVIILGIPIYMGKKVLSHGRKSQWSACHQCLSVASCCLLSLFVSPVITAVTVGVGVPLGLTYIYGVVVLSACRNRWGCAGGQPRKTREVGAVELENLARLNELLAALPTSSVPAEEEIASTITSCFPRQSQGQTKEPRQQHSLLTDASARVGSSPRRAKGAADRPDPCVVEVEIEAEPKATQERSPGCSAAPLAGTSDACSLAGVTTE